MRDDDFDLVLTIEIRKEFGRVAEACREANGLSKSAMAEKAEIDPRTLTRIENGAMD